MLSTTSKSAFSKHWAFRPDGEPQRSTLERLPGLAAARMQSPPYAAAALKALLHAKPKAVMFSAYGMREGQMLELLPALGQDPLISACEMTAERTGAS